MLPETVGEDEVSHAQPVKCFAHACGWLQGGSKTTP